MTFRHLLLKTSFIVIGIAATAILSAANSSSDDDTRNSAIAKAIMAARAGRSPTNQFFQPTAEEMNRAMQLGTAATRTEPFPLSKRDGVRLLMTGHSWVGPAVRTLPDIAAAAGFYGHR